MSAVVPVILCGGAGSRLWPLSRSLFPKQLLSLRSELTLLQETLTRVAGIQGVVGMRLVCNEDHRFAVAEQANRLGITNAQVVLEPCRRDTAPAVTAAAINVANEFGPDALLVVLPADHVITNQEAFNECMKKACDSAGNGALVTLGVLPQHPETGYGYIQRGAEHAAGVYKVNRFVEKPSADLAQEYLDSGEYLWNSGMFVFRADAWLREAANHAPEIVESCAAAVNSAAIDLDFLRLDMRGFAASPAISIDYAVMEKAAEVLVVPLDAGWSDIGSWASLAEARESDEHGNSTSGYVELDDCSGSMVMANHRLVAGVGLEDMVVVETSDAVLVVPKNRSQDIKGIVEKLRAEKRPEADLHRKVYRPWGSYESIDESDRFQVKRITVNPGAKLSLQMHHHRAEHWIVVKGTALVTKGDEEFLLSEDQSTYIPLGVTHRLENPGSIPLELIEVQSGAYLGEDDIVRFEDTYGRTGS